MDDFKTIISRAIADGQNLDDIMTKFAAAANEIEQEEKEKEKENSTYQFFKDIYDNAIHNIIDNDKLSYNEIVSLIAVCTYRDTDILNDMAIEEIEDYMKYIHAVLENLEHGWGLSCHIQTLLKDLFSNKSKDKAASKEFDQEDTRKLMSFLDNLFS